MLATIYDSPIYQAIYALMDSIPFVYVNAIGCIVLTSPSPSTHFSEKAATNTAAPSLAVPASGDCWRSSS